MITQIKESLGLYDRKTHHHYYLSSFSLSVDIGPISYRAYNYVKQASRHIYITQLLSDIIF